MAKANKNQLINYANSRIISTPTQPVQPTPSATMMGGGRGASQAAQQQAIVPSQTSNRILAGNFGDSIANIQGQKMANAVKAAQGNLTFQDAVNVRNEIQKYKDSLNPDTGNGGGGDDYYGGDVVRQVSDPYATIYALYENSMNALYENSMNAQRDALNQQRQARLNALQANYNNAKSKLDSSYASGETELNQNADEALRQAYISNMLNQRNMAQYLAGQGITGGAAESILANLYNTYGNNRNDIERGRMDNLRQLLANYQGTLGDIENSYLTGMSDADSDYSGSIADALTNYYNNLASLQAQNIANQYKAALNKSGSSKSADTSSGLDANTLKTMKSYKTYDSAKRYLDYLGIPEELQEAYFYESGQGDLLPANAEANAIANRSADNNQYALARQQFLNDVSRLYGTPTGNAGYTQEQFENNVATLMRNYANQFGLSEEQARAILAEAGF